METGSKSGSILDLPMETQEILKNIKYPTKRDDIIEQTRKSGATQDILKDIGMLTDKTYNSAEEVAKELRRR
jgi:hypothetical protein